MENYLQSRALQFMLITSFDPLSDDCIEDQKIQLKISKPVLLTYSCRLSIKQCGAGGGGGGCFEKLTLNNACLGITLMSTSSFVD